MNRINNWKREMVDVLMTGRNKKQSYVMFEGDFLAMAC
jgi:hypothetical protein